MAKFFVPIDRDSVKHAMVDPADVRYTGTHPAGPPTTTMTIEFIPQSVPHDVDTAVHMAAQEVVHWLRNARNSVVQRTNVSGMYGSPRHRPLTPGMVPPMPNPMPTIEMQIAVDPLITDMRAFHDDIDQYLQSKKMLLVRSQIDQTVPQATAYAYTGPSVKPSYDYEETTVECEGCGAEFVHTKLKRESATWPQSDGSEKEVESETVCPKCGYWDCCEVEYEKYGG